jgi:hypothetical protein
MWKPISKDEIEAMIAEGVAEMEEGVRHFWEQICIPPVKWQHSPWGDLGGGFWVIAIMGQECMYYNDIEDGFNYSPYDMATGTIEKYLCNQSDFLPSIRSWHRIFLKAINPPD